MCVNILPSVALLLVLPSPTTNTWNTNCNVGQDQKSQADRSAALLHAHRCYLKDVPIHIPAPVNTVPDRIIPSHVVVQRCSGETL